MVLILDRLADVQWAALVRFEGVIDRDSAIRNSPYFIGDTVLRVIEHDKGLNWRSATFTHDVWLMLLNFPPECWNLNTIITTLAPYGRFLVWNRDDSNKARILVKIRAFDLDSIPGSIVVVQNFSAEGYGNSWSCPCYILNTNMLGAGAGDEDPLPPDGANPHPVPIIIDDFAMWQEDDAPAMAPAMPPPANQNNEEPFLVTPPQSPAQVVNNAPVIEEPLDGIPAVIEPALPQMDEQAPDVSAPQHFFVEVFPPVLNRPTQHVSMSENNCNITTGTSAAVGPVISAAVDLQNPEASSSASEIQVNSNAHAISAASRKRKGKGKAPRSCEHVRRSSRLAKLKDGFKDATSNDDAQEEDEEAFEAEYFAQIRDPDAASPPHLPLKTIEALATGPCQMPLDDVSEENLNYDSTNDSVE